MALYVYPSTPQPMYCRRHHYPMHSRPRHIPSDIEDALGLVAALMDNLETSDVVKQTKFVLNKNNEFKFSYDVAGYKPEELKIDIEGRELIIHGYHQSENEHGKIEQQFTRKLLIPEFIDLESIKGSFEEEKNILEITGKRLEIKESEKKSIQIGIKKSDEKQVDQQSNAKNPEEKVEASTAKTEESH